MTTGIGKVTAERIIADHTAALASDARLTELKTLNATRIETVERSTALAHRCRKDSAELYGTIFEREALNRIATLNQVNDKLEQTNEDLRVKCVEAMREADPFREACADALALLVNGPQGCDDDPVQVIKRLRELTGAEEASSDM